MWRARWKIRNGRGISKMTIMSFLDQELEKDLLRFTLAGSVDDGKSTLIGRLLHDAQGVYEDQVASIRQATAKRGGGENEIDFALLTDGLKAEREQGITIDVAYRYFATAKRKFIIADTPGHVQYTRNMATGASTANLAIILIDASLGVLTQSRRHGFIASLLGINHIIVAVNKMDLVDYDEQVFDRIKKDYTDFVARVAMRDLTFIPVSALKGDNVVERSDLMPWYQGAPLLEQLESVHIASDRNLVDLRFPVQFVQRPNADFRGYAGTVASGVVRVGDEVMALPSRQKTRVKSIVTFDGELEQAFSGQAVTVTLEDEIDLSRGEMLIHPNNRPREQQRLETMLVWMSEKPAVKGVQCMVQHTSRIVPCRLTDVKYVMDMDTLHRKTEQTLQLNDIARVVLDVNRPLFVDSYEKNRNTGALILIDRLTNETIAAGMIIEREPAKHPEGIVKVDVKARNLTTHRGEVTTAQRQELLKQKGAVIWLTGLSGCGKSSLAFALEKRLIQDGHLAYVLDGDNVRQGLNADLGFSPEDRAENIRRIGETSALMADLGAITIAAFISPYRSDRDQARLAAPEGGFFEIHLDVSLAECERRDPKGLYRKARAGEIPDFTGIDAPYEAPENPELVLPAEEITVEEEVDRVIALLRKHGVLLD
ncbi:MAG: sulfate adenylyltransferase subunit CysN [Planctomycetes bacterium]|nr:sulfate adenylyltransferase subunit CysN [Planctomycetota bacterium]